MRCTCKVKSLSSVCRHSDRSLTMIHTLLASCSHPRFSCSHHAIDFRVSPSSTRARSHCTHRSEAYFSGGRNGQSRTASRRGTVGAGALGARFSAEPNQSGRGTACSFFRFIHRKRYSRSFSRAFCLRTRSMRRRLLRRTSNNNNNNRKRRSRQLRAPRTISR